MVVYRKGVVDCGIPEGGVLFGVDFILSLVWGEAVCFVTRDGGSAFASLGSDGSPCYGVNLGVPSDTCGCRSREVSPDALSLR